MATKFKLDREKLAKKQERVLKQRLNEQARAFQKRVKEQKAKIKQEREKLERRYSRELTRQLSKAVKEERERQKSRERQFKDKLEKSSKERFDKERKKLQKQQTAFERRQRVQRDKNEKLIKQYRTLQDKNEKQLGQANRKIKSLEEQVKKQATPQVLGLLEEKVFLKKLKEMFPQDEFVHTGKRGDIVHYVNEKGKKVGTMVYELKKVANFSQSHVTQTVKAKRQRQADYAMLVTNAKRAKDHTGFFMAKGVIVIHPAGALVLIGILRDQLIQLSRLKLSKQERSKTVRAVMEYIQGAEFKNSITGIIQDTIELYENLQKEIKTHLKLWEYRLEKYRGIHGRATTVESRAVNLVVGGKKRRIPRREGIEPIAISVEID